MNNGLEFRSVISSNIKGIAHDGEDLYVEFNNGSRYKYFGVPDSVYQEFINTASPGTFLNDNIKGAYRHQRV